MNLNANARILKVERRGGMDRYGEPQWEVIDEDLLTRLVHRTRIVIGRDGVQGTVDADMIIPAQYGFDAGDKVTMMDEHSTAYTILSCDDLTRTSGEVVFKRYGLVRLQDDVR